MIDHKLTLKTEENIDTFIIAKKIVSMPFAQYCDSAS